MEVANLMNVPEKTTVIVTEDHIKLLQRMYVYWEDSMYDGAPAINIKRPYGNSWVWGDVAEILGWEWDQDDDMPEEIEERCKAIHEQMSDVLQVLVRNPLTFGVGTWEAIWPMRDYRRVS
jgi:hypothetical protein